MSLIYAAPLLQVRAEPSGTVKGYASVFGVRDSHGDIVERGAFAGIGTKTIPMLMGHDQSKPIGHWSKLVEDEAGLFVEGQINLKTTAGKDAFEHVINSDISGISVGFLLPEDGYQYRDGIRFLRRVDLKEISLVAVPSNDAARVLEARGLDQKPNTLRDFENLLKKQGFSRREATALATGGWTAYMDEATQAQTALQRMQAALSAFKF